MLKNLLVCYALVFIASLSPTKAQYYGDVPTYLTLGSSYLLDSPSSFGISFSAISGYQGIGFSFSATYALRPEATTVPQGLLSASVGATVKFSVIFVGAKMGLTLMQQKAVNNSIASTVNFNIGLMAGLQIPFSKDFGFQVMAEYNFFNGRLPWLDADKLPRASYDNAEFKVFFGLSWIIYTPY